MNTLTPSAQRLWAPLGPCGPPWALEGLPGLLWAPLGPCGPGPCGLPRALVGRALVGPLGPLWAPWALMGWALMGHAGIYIACGRGPFWTRQEMRNSHIGPVLQKSYPGG